MTGVLWTAAEIAAATGGTARGTWSVGGVSIDSRTLERGELFIALRGPCHDGHAYVLDALGQGAAALVERAPEGVPDRAPLVLVEDTAQALTALGRAARARSGARILAVTGSVGKTGTKEALRLALGDQAPTHASSASHNNHWGVPLSLARAPRDTAYAVYELGMNAPGEIAHLTSVVRPHVALITSIAAAHIGFFSSLEAIADAKAEIFTGLEPGGSAVLNADGAQFERLRAAAEAAGASVIITFGAGSRARVRLRDARLAHEASDVVASLDGETIAYRIGAPGRHWVQNSLAVIAGAFALGADPRLAAASLARFRPPKGRGERHRIPWQGGVITLIDESYNANPASMRAALALLENAPGRTLAALGDMLELGEQAASLHAALAEPAAAAGVARIHTAGPLMHHLHAVLPPGCKGVHADDAQALWPQLAADLRPGDTLLVKGSLGSRMGTIVHALLAAGAEPQPRKPAPAGTEG